MLGQRTKYNWKETFASHCKLGACRTRPMEDFPDDLADERREYVDHGRGPDSSRCGYGQKKVDSIPSELRQCTAKGCYKEYPREEALKCHRCFRRHYCSRACRRGASKVHHCAERREGKECCAKSCTKEGNAKYNTKVCTHCGDFRYCSRRCKKEGWRLHSHKGWCLGFTSQQIKQIDRENILAQYPPGS